MIWTFTLIFGISYLLTLKLSFEDIIIFVLMLIFRAWLVLIYMTIVYRYQGYNPHTCLIFSCRRYVSIILHFLKHPVYCKIYCLSSHFWIVKHLISDLQDDQLFDLEIASRTRIMFFSLGGIGWRKLNIIRLQYR